WSPQPRSGHLAGYTTVRRGGSATSVLDFFRRRSAGFCRVRVVPLGTPTTRRRPPWPTVTVVAGTVLAASVVTYAVPPARCVSHLYRPKLIRRCPRGGPGDRARPRPGLTRPTSPVRARPSLLRGRRHGDGAAYSDPGEGPRRAARLA